jgi:serine/threonine protein phosphatase 1
MTLLAVGDVHGCLAELEAMIALLTRVVAQAVGTGRSWRLVMLGDYVDRGPDSLGVLRRLGRIEADLGCPVDLLLGNHDLLLDRSIRLMPDPEVMSGWYANGGDTTLAECGIGPDELDGGDPAAIAARVRARLGPKLLRLVRDLAPAVRAGGYLFVHAGIDPGRAPEQHGIEELVWLREPFLTGADWRHPFAVVHGHTPCGPDVHPHRIGVDSGCFHTGVLTAVELAEDRLRFHCVTREPDPRLLLDPGQPRRFGAAEPIA